MTFIVIILLILVGIFFWLSTQSGDYEVSRKRLIKADQQALFDTVSDFKTWPEWTPWLAHEQDCPLQFSEQSNQEGSWYSWDGKIIGAGKLTQNQLQSPEQIDSTIEFTRPMKSKSQVKWEFKPTDSGTEVTWSMNGSMPFLFRWMAGKMDQWVGKDYEIGLNNLAMQMGDNEKVFKLDFTGTTEQPAEKYLSSYFEGSLDDLPKVMPEGYQKLHAALEASGQEISGTPLAIYHKVNPKKRTVKCEMALPVANPKPIDEFDIGELPARRYSRTVLHGDYQHLEHAWHSAFSHIRMAKQKYNWKHPMLERYITDPRENSGLDLITHLEIPLK